MRVLKNLNCAQKIQIFMGLFQSSLSKISSFDYDIEQTPFIFAFTIAKIVYLQQNLTPMLFLDWMEQLNNSIGFVAATLTSPIIIAHIIQISHVQYFAKNNNPQQIIIIKKNR
eukprot:TRINITY_DN10385_c1_g1_i1.p1 TRINITY_DN10385_c1_g1~~TRINITY_DN10385_c1_g1_i1.p1  ORF type:complete len:113 (-),score=3.92 TRINITY_DN10385_c1_g1_i1:55-393(-)